MNDINLLMSRIEEINAKSADDVTADDADMLILYYRRQRQRRASGEKFTTTTPPPDLSALLNLRPTKAITSSTPTPSDRPKRI